MGEIWVIKNGGGLNQLNDKQSTPETTIFYQIKQLSDIGALIFRIHLAP